jgi:adenylylsulfate kinase
MLIPEQSGWALWLTGPPASGKTTIARALQRRLGGLGVVAAVLDSDDLRPLLAPAGGYSPAERDAFYQQLVELAAWLAREGINVIIAATGHRRAYRNRARAALAPFAEVWVRCPLDVCQARDPKGLYVQAQEGAITQLPGVGTPYEPPSAPDLILDSDLVDAPQAAELLLAGIPFLERRC